MVYQSSIQRINDLKLDQKHKISPLYVIFGLPVYLFTHHLTKSKIRLYLHLCDDEKKRRLSIRKRCLQSIAFPALILILIAVNAPVSNAIIAIAVIPLLLVYLVFIWLYFLTSQPLAFVYSESGRYYLHGAHSDFLKNYPELVINDENICATKKMV